MNVMKTGSLKDLRKKLVLGSLAALASCVQIPDDGKQPVLATHVDDWRDEVIYQVLTDRFADGDENNNFLVRRGFLARYQGGDWKGMREHLDYFKALGVTTLWISPIIRNVETDADVDAYHGYWAQDLTQLNPHFGDLAELRRLTAAAHEQGMKIVLDIVTNHMGQIFFYDMNLNGNADIYIGGTGTSSPVTRVSEFDPDYDTRGIQASTSLGEAGRAPLIFINTPGIQRVPPPGILGTAVAYHGRGRTLNYDIPEQRLFGDFPGGLKDVATENPEVRRVMIDNYTHWAEAADLDGFRIDTVKHVEEDFWNEFAKGVRDRLAPQNKKKFLMFGEAFDGNDELLGRYTQPGRLDSVFYFSQHYQVFRDIFQNAAFPGQQAPTSHVKKLYDSREKNWGQEPQPGGVGVAPARLPVNFIDNHDVARFLFGLQGVREPLRTNIFHNALSYLLTAEGIPCVYYGTEQAFAGGNDPSNREVLWTTNFDTTGDAFRHIAKLTSLRREHIALRRGRATLRFTTEHVGSEDDAGLLAYERSGPDAGNDYALVVINTHPDKPASATFASGLPSAAALKDVLGVRGDVLNVDATGNVRVLVDPMTTMIFVKQ